jgi:serine/threonine protein kinase
MTGCVSCGSEIAEGGRFCSSCGRAVVSDTMATQTVAVSASAPQAKSSNGSSSPASHISNASAAGRFAPGQILGGRYRIVALLGKGGMGEVYRADDLALEQQVALKFLPELLSTNDAALARFRGEVRIARQVSHPNVCRVYDLGEAGGQYFLSMEYVDGEDLGSLLRRIGRLPSDKALEIARQLCAGLAAAHAKGVLHRDLKPGNVMLDARGQVLLTDFGLAGLAGQVEGCEVRNGTPAYMAPEQLAGQEVTVRSDIYSLGLVLYEIFTGKLPYESTTLAGLIQAQKESAPISPSTLVREMDPAIERAILRCLQSKPAQRPSSALAVAAALPGGDPLAAALAAGETPSPEMVAEAGQGEGISLRRATLLLVLVCICIGSALTSGNDALEMLRPEYPPEVLVQKAKDLIARFEPGLSRGDQAYGFTFDPKVLDDIKKQTPNPDWKTALPQRPELLHFWYRQRPSSLTGLMLHDDLLTPGIVQEDDPPFEDSGGLRLKMDARGNLLLLERVPDQKLAPDSNSSHSVDWNSLFAAAGLDAAKFHNAEPLWTSLETSDTRIAWTGSQPRPLRVEAAALRGQPVYFQVIQPWTKPDRAGDEGTSTGDAIKLTIYTVIALGCCFASAWLARRNLTQGRGDRRGAFRLAAFFFAVQMAIWLTESHLTVSAGTLGMFFIALATSVFYGVLIWTVYLALEPYARRRWPHTLISWSSVLIGRLRDPMVGADVLRGCALGASLSMINSVGTLIERHSGGAMPNLTGAGVLLGLRGTLATCLFAVPHGIREALFFFFMILILRALLRNQWVAGAVFVLLWSATNIGSNHVALNLALSAGVFSILAFAMLRRGLLTMAVCVFVSMLLGNAPLTLQTQAWYFNNQILMVGIVVAMALWAFRTAIAGHKLWKEDLLA